MLRLKIRQVREILFNLYRQYLLDNGGGEDQIVGLALDGIDNTKYRNPAGEKLAEYLKCTCCSKKIYKELYNNTCQYYHYGIYW